MSDTRGWPIVHGAECIVKSIRGSEEEARGEMGSNLGIIGGARRRRGWEADETWRRWTVKSGFFFQISLCAITGVQSFHLWPPSSHHRLLLLSSNNCIALHFSQMSSNNLLCNCNWHCRPNFLLQYKSAPLCASNTVGQCAHPVIVRAITFSIE